MRGERACRRHSRRGRGHLQELAAARQCAARFHQFVEPLFAFAQVFLPAFFPFKRKHYFSSEDQPRRNEEHEERTRKSLVFLVSPQLDRKSTRLNSSHVAISYAVFCLKKKKRQKETLFLKKKYNKPKK